MPKERACDVLGKKLGKGLWEGVCRGICAELKLEAPPEHPEEGHAPGTVCVPEPSLQGPSDRKPWAVCGLRAGARADQHFPSGCSR